MIDTTVATSEVLSKAQREQFIHDGYTVASGLIPQSIIQRTLDELCSAMSVDRDDKSTWPAEERTNFLEDVTLTEECFTPSFEAAAQELVGDILLSQYCISSVLDEQGKEPYVRGFIPVMAYPREGEQKFSTEWPGQFHVDGKHFSSVWPDKILLVALIYLTDTTEYGGATSVIPGSHRQIFERGLQADEGTSPRALVTSLENPQPAPAPGKAGDVIFMHHLLAHSGSKNYDDHIRFALNANLARDLEKPYVKKDGAPQPDWTPLDWTLRTDNLALV